VPLDCFVGIVGEEEEEEEDPSVVSFSSYGKLAIHRSRNKGAVEG